MYEVIIFDLDGTLLDTLDDLHASVNAALATFSYPLRTREEVRSFVGNGIAKLIERALGGKTQDFDGTGDYSWVSQNCHRYGYILRYPADKTEITEISYEPWHFRYVGKEHAYYMMANNLCLEEYIHNLSKFTADGDRLIFETDDGEKYMIYSQPVSGSSASVYVPKNLPYTLSGDNNGRIIVSCKIA